MNFDQREVNGFLYADGKKLRNGAGEELLLRGVGLGSWLLPEGYMWRFPEKGDRPRRIEAMIAELIGEEDAVRFWQTYYENYVAEADIRRMAEEGLNSLRIPINARFLAREGVSEPEWHDEHLAMLDRIIGWCRTYRIYAILDLHGAPGGQTGTNIDDSENDLPELFTDERNKRQTVELWRMLAERYKDERIVAGYDLLNEPLPNWFAQYNDQVMPLYVDIINAIREVDSKHLIILEGVHWATDWSIFTTLPDNNVLLQFHKYWNNPESESIQTYLDKRDELNAPLFMGEGGENNKDWYTGAFRLFEDHDISWNFWTWKKLDTTNSPCSVNLPEGWHKLVAYLEGGSKPEAAEAQAILDEYLSNLLIENCTYHADVVSSLFRRLPVRIPAIFYGYKGEGVSFGRASSDKAAEGIAGFRSNDGMTFRFVDSERVEANFQHGQGQEWQPDEWLCVELAAGDWAVYEFTTGEQTAGWTAELMVRLTDETAKLYVALDQVDIGCISGQALEWRTATVSSGAAVEPGLHSLTIRAESGPVQIQWLKLSSV
ncbi:glycoside hydrolase family 5 protein [Paenibacillus sp. YIM B09110]|uniref:glycoside hydrolase family 5 protein n=1 Tax=Paenibacillus sp. YIM B09110 TaxID=3126102 RepID=UPI00301C4A5A